MLKGFENITRDLSQAEKEKLLPKMVAGLRKRIGKGNAITSTEIIEAFRTKNNIDLSDAVIRKIVNHIRNKDIIPGLVASSSGYYVTYDPVELKRHIDSLAGREAEIRRTKEAMIRHLKKISQRTQGLIELDR